MQQRTQSASKLKRKSREESNTSRKTHALNVPNINYIPTNFINIFFRCARIPSTGSRSERLHFYLYSKVFLARICFVLAISLFLFIPFIQGKIWLVLLQFIRFFCPNTSWTFGALEKVCFHLFQATIWSQRFWCFINVWSLSLLNVSRCTDIGFSVFACFPLLMLY